MAALNRNTQMSTRTTLANFEESLGNIGNVIIAITQTLNMLNNLPQASRSMVGIQLLEFLIGKIWAIRNDTDVRTLSFQNFYSLIGEPTPFIADPIKRGIISMWRNNLGQHMNKDSFDFDGPHFKNSLDNGVLDDVLDEIYTAYIRMCKYFGDEVRLREFAVMIDGTQKRKFVVGVVVEQHA